MGGDASIFDRLRAKFGRKSPGGSPPTTSSKSPPTAVPAPGRKVDLVLGIDFGTSCTKVVIGDPGWRAKSYAVPLVREADGISRFLKPTRLRLRVAQGAEQVENNLKLRLMREPDSREVRDWVALYLARVIRQSLEWFREAGPSAYAGSQPVWSFNLGFPAKRVAEDEPLTRAYREVAHLAAAIGASDLPLSSTTLRALQARGGAEPTSQPIPNSRVQLYPEIAAQLAGYINSPYRARGNLLLIDVGAGTLDVSTMILHGDDQEDVVSFHFCEVEPFGAFKLFEHRAAAIEQQCPKSAGLIAAAFLAGAGPAPDDLRAMLPAHLPMNDQLRTAFGSASDRFAQEAVRVALSCLIRFRKSLRDSHANSGFDPWPGQLRFFFTGGGSRSLFYRQHFVDGPLEQQLTRFTRWSDQERVRRSNGQGLRLERLPLPADLHEFPAALTNDFDRLSVAHGLAYGGDNLMRITTSKDS